MNQRTQVRGLHPDEPGKLFLADPPFLQLPSQDITRMDGESRRNVVCPVPSFISCFHNALYVHFSVQFMDKYTNYSLIIIIIMIIYL